MSITSKILRQSIHALLDYILSSMDEKQTILFLQTFKEKLQESLEELNSQLTVPSGENKK